MHREPLLSFREYCLAYQIKELLAVISYTYDLSLLYAHCRNLSVLNKTYIYSVALAYSDFVAGDSYAFLHLEKIRTVLHEWTLGAWLRSVVCSCPDLHLKGPHS
jgi:hypothetical protein